MKPHRVVVALLFAACLCALSPTPSTAQAPGAGSAATNALPPELAELRAEVHVTDSLSALSDSSTGTARELLEELIWQRQTELHADLLGIIEKLEADQARGRDMTEARRVLAVTLREGWPHYLAQLERRQRALVALGKTSEAASGAQRLAIETQMTQLSDRLIDSYGALVDVMLALERLGVDVGEQRAYMSNGLRQAAGGLATRLKLVQRERSQAAARLSREAANVDLRYAFDAADERLKRATLALTAAIRLMDRLGLEDTDLRVALIASTGRVTTDIFKWSVLTRLARVLGRQLADFLAGKAPQWLFQALLIVLTFVAFRWLSRLAGRIVRRIVGHSSMSELMRATVARLARSAVMLVGIMLILTQLGVQVAPLLAGLGIAGFVVGFAMQNTLSNFAAGGMILGNRPFDVGDEIEVAGVSGIVNRMSLVSTTILTYDNQTLIIPNNTIWSGVIRNRTAQPLRRVDLVVGVSYADDVERVERVLADVVAGLEHVLKAPPPTIKVSELAESSVNFVVRVWTRRESYWSVYWDLTRAVKLRFDREGITIPFPQRDVHLHAERGEAGAAPRS